jgi:hypothetical protein
VQVREWVGVLLIVSDPKMFPGRVVADADTELGRVQFTATGRAASVVGQASAGRLLSVRGTLRNLAHPDRVAYRHVRMALSASEASLETGTELWRVPVDLVRGAILRGAQVLPEDQRPLYTGFVIGDDRGSRDEVVQAFNQVVSSRNDSVFCNYHTSHRNFVLFSSVYGLFNGHFHVKFVFVSVVQNS